MKKLATFLVIVISAILFTASAFAQVDVTATEGTPSASYTTLKGAFDAINAGTHKGVITIGISGNTNEGTATATLNASGAGSASYTSITITPTGGAARTIVGNTTAGNPLIDFNGADNVTIDGLNTDGNSLTIVNTTASATSGTSTIRFINGATNNLITRCNIQGSHQASVATNGAIIFFSTDGSTPNGNDNNTISYCNLSPSSSGFCSKAILGNGSQTTTAIGNSGIVIDNNNIFDIFAPAVTSAAIAVNNGCNNWTISNNKIYQTTPKVWTTGALHNAINIQSSTATYGAQGFTITGNIIGYASSTQTGTYALSGSSGSFRAIVYNGITGGTLTNINNNTIASISLTGVTASGTGTSSPFSAIVINNGLVTTNGNTIGSQSATGSLIFSTNTTSATDVYGIYNYSLDDWTANNNNIGGISVTNAAASGTFLLYGLRANTSTSKVFNASGNNIGGTVANSIQLTATGTSSQVIGMATTNAAATWVLNTIRNLTTNVGTGTTTSASMIGMLVNSTTVNHTLSRNTIHTLINTHATAASVVTGIQFAGGTANIVERNFIYNLLASTNSAAAEINGIRTGGGTTIYRNNMIALGANQAVSLGGGASNTSTTGINGFSDAGGINNIWHNSIFIGGSPTSGSGASYAFNGTVTTNTRSYRNNIFFNARSNNGATGSHYAIKINGTTPNPTGLTINNNVYFVNGEGKVFGYFNNANVADLINWRTVVGQDAASMESNPQYYDPANAVPDLHIHPTNPTVVEGMGADVGVVDDFDGDIRANFTPVDIGADAGNFVLLDIFPPTISYTPLLNTNSLSERTLYATITDASGVPQTGIGLPVLYWKIDNGSWNSAQGSWNADLSKYQFTFGSGVSEGSTVYYYIVAQDEAPTPNVGAFPSAGAGGFTTNPPAASTPPTTPSSYVITAAPLAGDYKVGTSAFKNATGIDLTFEKRTRIVLREVLIPIPEAEQATSEPQRGEIQNLAPAVDELKFKTELMEVEEVYYVPMVNGKEYTGPLYIKNDDKNSLKDWDGVYATLTAAIADLNLRGVSGHTRFHLVDANYSTGETFPLNIQISNENLPSATATVSFKPDPGVTSTISGSVASSHLIRIRNSYVTIDGSNITDGTTRDLTITNTNTTSPIVIAIGMTGTTPVTNVTVKNCIIINGAQTSSAIVITDGTGSAGYFNNITIQNNSVRKAYVGIYALGVVATGNGSGLLITGNDLNSTGADAIRLVGIYVQGVDGATVTYNNIENITNANAENPRMIWFAAGTNSGTIANNTISNVSFTNTGAYALTGIYITSTTVTNLNINNNIISNLTNAGTALSFAGILTFSPNTNITNNTVTNLTQNGAANFWGIVSSGALNANISNNTVSQLTTATTGPAHGINIQGASINVNIMKNRISNIKNTNTGGWSAVGLMLMATGTASNITVANNFIWDVAGYGFSSTTTDNGYGINISSGGGYKLYYNSINLATNQTSTSGIPAALIIGSGITTANTLDIRNNIFSIPATVGTNRYAVLCNAANTVFSDINYNNYYTSGPNLGYIGGTNRADIAAWRTGTGKDLNSKFADPLFSGPGNLYIPVTVNSPVNRAGTPIVGIDEDIDGEDRNDNWPDIGADEYTPNPPGTVTLISPLNNDINIVLTPTLTWSPVSMATHYDVYLEANNPDPTNKVCSLQTSTSFPVTTPLQTATDYYWKVVAWNDTLAIKAQSSSSPVWKFTTVSPPEAPTNLAVDSITPTSMQLSWIDNAPSAGNPILEDSFFVYRKVGAPPAVGAPYTDRIAMVDASPGSGGTVYYNDNGPLTPNTRYYYRVTAYNQTTGESYFTGADAWTLANTPGQPTLSDAGYTSMKIVLDPASNPASTEFVVRVVYGSTTKYMNTSGALVDAPVWGTYSAFGGASGRVVTGLTPGTSYTFDVKARNGASIETDFGPSATESTLAPVSTFPYVQNFDGATTEGWSTGIFSGTVNNWVRGTPAKTQISAPHSAPNAWVTKTTGTYDNNHNAFLLSPLFSFASLTTDPYLEFWHNFKTETNYDAGILEYSLDGGSTWRRVDSTLGTGGNYTTAKSFNWYNNSSSYGPITPIKWSGGSTAYTGHSSGWIKSTTKLVGFAGQNLVQFRWRFGSDVSGVDEGWAIDDVTIYAVPNSPTALSVAEVFVDSITLSWTDNSNNELGFYIYKSINGTTFTKVDSVVENITSYSGTHAGGLTPNTRYWWRVSAYNSYGESGYSQADTTTLARTPGQPVISDITNSSMVVKIDPVDNPASTEFAIRVSYQTPKVTKYVNTSGVLVDEPVWATYAGFGGTGGVMVTGLQQTTEYTFDVKARNANNIETDFGPSAQGTTTATPPPNAPTDLVITNVTNNSMDLSWSDQSDNEILFYIYKSTDGSIFIKVDSVNANTVIYTGEHSRSLSPNERYWWRVAAYNDYGTSGFASADSTTLANTPGAPTLSDAGYTSMKVVLNPAGNPASTELAVRVVYGSTTKYMNTAGVLVDAPVWGTYSAFGGATGRTMTGLTVNTLYTVDVKARNANNIETDFGASSALSTTGPPTTFSEDFSTYAGNAPPPVGWIEGDQKDILDGGTFGTPSNGGWYVDGFGNVGTTGAARFNYYGTATVDHDWLVSPVVSLTTKAPQRLLFDLALTLYNVTTPTTMDANDTMFVVVSTDSGKTFPRSNVVAMYHAGTPISNTGQTESINLSAFGAQPFVRIGFYAKDLAGSGDKDLFIDNVRLQAIVDKDIEVVSVSLTPGPPYYTGIPLTVNAQIRNNGEEPNPTSVPLTYKVGVAPDYQGDGVGQIFTPSWVGNIANVSFTTTYTHTTLDSLKMFVKSFYPGDQVTTNDLASVTVHVRQAGILFEDFTGTTFPPEGWKIVNNDGGSYNWERVTTKFRSAPASASSRWESSTLRNDDWLITPRLRVSAGDSLTFYHSAYSSTWPESLYVRLSTTGNSPSDTWIDLLAIRDADTSWKYKKVDLTYWAGQKIYIAFVNRGLNMFRIYVDDVTGPAIYVPEHDIGVVALGQSFNQKNMIESGLSRELYGKESEKLLLEKEAKADVSITILAPEEIGTYKSSSPVTLKAVVRNFGTSIENNYQVGWWIDNMPQISVNNTEPLEVGDTDTLDLVWASPTPGPHSARAWSILPGDEIPANDTSSVFNFYVTAPNVVFFEGFNTTFPPTGWTRINRDGGGTTGPWFAGNPAVFTAYEGTSYAADNYASANGLYIDDYLITPNTGSGGKSYGTLDSLVFWARSVVSQYNDSLQILVSTTGTNVEDFTILLDYINVPKGAWTRFAYALPNAENRYIAFRYLHYNGGPDGAHSDYFGIDAVEIHRYLIPNSISGMKFNDLNGNGQKDEGEPGLEGWYISLNGPVNDVKVTGPDGSYLFGDLPDGEYLITEDNQSGWLQTMPPAPGSYTVVVSGGMNVTGKDFGNFKLGKISGYKWEDVNGNGVWDVNEPPVANWQIVLNGPVSRNTVTNENGLYVFENLPVGEYTISENIQNGWYSTYPTPAYHTVNILSGTEISGQHGVAGVPNFGNTRFGTVSGMKFWDRNNNGVKDPGEVGLANWEIILTGVNTPARSTFTNTEGNFIFENVKPDFYTLTEVVKNGWTNTVSPAPFSIISGQVITDKLFGNFRNADAVKYRSFVPEDLVALINGKVPKAVKRKPVGAYWEFMIVNPKEYPLTLLNIQFKNDVKQIVDAGDFTVTGAKKDFMLTDAVLEPGDTVIVKGYSLKGKPQEIKKLWYGPKATIPDKDIKPSYQYLELPMPTWVNMIDEIFAEGGFQNGGGLLVGQKGDPKKIGWVFITKSGDVVKSLYNKGIHNAGPKFFRTFDNNKPFLKEQKSLPPTKQNNKLFAEIVAAKLAIAASKLGKIPAGYPDLIFIDDDIAWHPFNNMTVEEIVDSISNAMNTFEGDSADYYRIIRKLNTAFAGPIDTVSFGPVPPGVVLKGVRALAEVPYLFANPDGKVSRIEPKPIVYQEVPSTFELLQNYPNPFNPTTVIEFTLPEDAVVTLKVYNLLGQEVATLIDDEIYTEGLNNVEFDASKLSSGVYFYRLVAETLGEIPMKYSQVKKMILMK